MAEMVKQPIFWVMFVPVFGLVFGIQRYGLDRFERIDSTPDESKARFRKFIKEREAILSKNN